MILTIPLWLNDSFSPSNPFTSLGVSEDERTALQLPWENRGLQQGGAGGGGSLKEIYMDKLPTEIVDKLFDKLAADFAMFGYTIEDEF